MLAAFMRRRIEREVFESCTARWAYALKGRTVILCRLRLRVEGRPPGRKGKSEGQAGTNERYGA